MKMETHISSLRWLSTTGFVALAIFAMSTAYVPSGLGSVIVLNASFEANSTGGVFGPIANWTQVPSSTPYGPYISGTSTAGGTYYDNGDNPDGPQVAFMEVGPLQPTLSLEQSISGFLPGYMYRLQYSENARDNQDDPFLTVSIIDGGTTNTIVNTHEVLPVDPLHTFVPPFTFVESLTFIPTFPNLTLRFTTSLGSGDADSTVLLDNVSFASVPEPSVVALLGMAGVILLQRRGRKS